MAGREAWAWTTPELRRWNMLWQSSSLTRSMRRARTRSARRLAAQPVAGDGVNEYHVEVHSGASGGHDHGGLAEQLSSSIEPWARATAPGTPSQGARGSDATRLEGATGSAAASPDGGDGLRPRTAALCGSSRTSGLFSGDEEVCAPGSGSSFYDSWAQVPTWQRKPVLDCHVTKTSNQNHHRGLNARFEKVQGVKYTVS